jgi:hypothetical protein
VREAKSLAIPLARHDAVLGIERRALYPHVEVLEISPYGFCPVGAWQ